MAGELKKTDTERERSKAQTITNCIMFFLKMCRRKKKPKEEQAGSSKLKGITSV